MMTRGSGAAVGTPGAVGLDPWLMHHYEMAHLPLFHVDIGVLAMLVLAQGALLVPARRASHVPPLEATRSV